MVIPPLIGLQSGFYPTLKSENEPVVEKTLLTLIHPVWFLPFVGISSPSFSRHTLFRGGSQPPRSPTCRDKTRSNPEPRHQQINTVMDKWPLLCNGKNTACTDSSSLFCRFIDCVAASLLQILYEKWRRHFFPAFAFPGRFLALAYPHLSDCISANIEP